MSWPTRDIGSGRSGLMPMRTYRPPETDALLAVTFDTEVTRPAIVAPPPDTASVTRIPGLTSLALLGLTWPEIVGLPIASVSALALTDWPTAALSEAILAGSRGTKVYWPSGTTGPRSAFGPAMTCCGV
jgi:hypothetical protein